MCVGWPLGSAVGAIKDAWAGLSMPASSRVLRGYSRDVGDDSDVEDSEDVLECLCSSCRLVDLLGYSSCDLSRAVLLGFSGQGLATTMPRRPLAYVGPRLS